MVETIKVIIVANLPTDVAVVEREIQKVIPASTFQVADTSAAYIAALDTFQPAIIISDFQLPHFDGLRAIKIARERAPLTPVIIFTAVDDDETAVECMKAGAVDYVNHPYLKRLGQAAIRGLEEYETRLERRRSDIALRESEEHFRNLYENASIGLYRTTPDGRILMANQAAIRMLGYETLEDLANRDLQQEPSFTSFPRFPRSEFMALIEREGNVRNIENSWVKKDGSTIYIRESARVIRDSQGVVQYYDGTFEDITQRKAAEERVKQEMLRSQTLLRTASRLNASLDLNHAIHTVYEETARALNAALVSIFLYDETRDLLFATLTHGTGAEFRAVQPQVPLSVFAEIKQQAATTVRLTEFLPTPPALPENTDHPAPQPVMTLAVMRTHETIVGAIGIVPGEPAEELSPDDLALLEGIADQAALAISNARLFTQQKLIESALRESEARYRTLIDLLPDAVTVTDYQGNVTYISRASLQIYGYAQDEEDAILGRSILDWVYAAEQEKASADFKFVFNGGIIRNHEYFLVRKDNTLFQGEFSASPLTDAQGHTVGIIITARDISHRKRAEEAIRDSEERYRTLAETANDLIFILDLEGKYQYLNRFGAEYLGITPEAAIGKTRYDMFPAEVAHQRVSIMEQVIATGQTSYDESIAPMAKGATWLGTTLVPLRDAEGKITAIMGVARDISDKKKAEKALAQSEERYRVISHLTSDIAYTVGVRPDGSSMPEWTSEAFNQLTGYDIDNGADPRVSLANIVHSEDRKEAFKHLLNSTQGKTGPAEHRIITRQGDVRWLRGFRQLIWDPDQNRVVRIIGAAQDITDQKLAEEALRRSEADYRKRTQELEMLFAFSKRVRSANTADEMYPMIIGELQRVVSMDAAAIALYNDEDHQFTITFTAGIMGLQPGISFPADQGLSGQILRERQTIITRDYSTEANWVAHPVHQQEIGPTIMIPLQSENSLVGYFMVVRRKAQAVQEFSTDEVRLLVSMSEIAGNALHRARLFDETQHHLQQTQALQEIQSAVVNSLDANVTLNVALDLAMGQLGIDAIDVLLIDPAAANLVYRAGRGFRAQNPAKTVVKMGADYAGVVAQEKRMIRIQDVRIRSESQTLPDWMAVEGFVSYIGIPLVAKGQAKGVLEVFQRSQKRISGEWLAFLETLAGQLAVALDNLSLFTDLQQSNQQLSVAYDATIEALSRALDLRDRETEDHTRRVTDLAEKLGQAMGLPDADLLQIKRGAMLHDIGKMGIPDSILLKPGPLTAEEWDVMRMHPQFAYDIFSFIDYLRPALDIPYCHHEKWDGSGYPRGLSGEEIPLSARLFAVVDVWDALTSERPYRSPWTNEQALAYLCEGSGKHFDPHAVEMFMKVLIDHDRTQAIPAACLG
jgi:PAS domain S-box-containing protein